MRPAEPGDRTGAATLERMAAAPRYNRWMFERLRPWVGHRVLEIGAGIGNMSAFLTDRERVVLTDTEDYYLGRLRARFEGERHVTVAELRLPAVEPRLKAERLDTVVCLNVLEHIENDRQTLLDMHDVLKPGGRLILLVPALQKLYGTLDVHLRHFRRYEKAELTEKLSAAGFSIEDCRFVNRPGVLGWWVNGKLLRRRVLPRGQLAGFRLLMPLLRREETNPPSTGMSLLATARKP
jgi:SAM-dependent methyltransferase